jgi:TRAP-type C4-dicarboxylate transport system permease small subunit
MRNIITKTAVRLSIVASTVAKICNALGTLVVLALVLVVDYDVIARGLFNMPFRGTVEVVQFSMVLIVFLQLPDVVRVNRLTRSDGLLTVIAHKYPNVASALRRAINTVSAVLMLLIAVALWPEFLDMFETKDFFGIPGIFMAPWWPIKLTIVLSASLCALLFILKVILNSEDIELVRMDEMKDDKTVELGENS